jgi:hypothetical protein
LTCIHQLMQMPGQLSNIKNQEVLGEKLNKHHEKDRTTKNHKRRSSQSN